MANYNQGFSNNWNINWQQVGFDGIIGGVTSFLGGKLAKPLEKPLANLLGGIQSPVLRNVAANEMTGIPVGSLLGGLEAIGDNDPNTSFGEGMWRGARSALVSSGLTGLGAATQYSLDYDVNFFTGESTTKTVSTNAMPTQMHHFATNKNSKYTPMMKEITDKYGLDLDGDWNKAPMPHIGRHPNAYHLWVLNQMQTINRMQIGRAHV